MHDKETPLYQAFVESLKINLAYQEICQRLVASEKRYLSSKDAKQLIELNETVGQIRQFLQQQEGENESLLVDTSAPHTQSMATGSRTQ